MDPSVLEKAYERFGQAAASADIKALEAATTRRYIHDLKNAFAEQGLGDDAIGQMLQQIGGGTDKNIFGQFVDGCLAGGSAGPTPGAGPGPYLIQLYKDPDSGDS